MPHGEQSVFMEQRLKCPTSASWLQPPPCAPKTTPRSVHLMGITGGQLGHRVLTSLMPLETFSGHISSEPLAQTTRPWDAASAPDRHLPASSLGLKHTRCTPAPRTIVYNPFFRQFLKIYSCNHGSVLAHPHLNTHIRSSDSCPKPQN